MVRKVSILIDDIRREKSRATGAMAVAGEKQKSGSAGAGERIDRINGISGMGGQTTGQSIAWADGYEANWACETGG